VSKLYYIIICKLLLLFQAQGQDLNGTVELANLHREHGMYDTAVEHYRRALYFAPDTLQAALFPAIAETLLLAEKFAESIFFFRLSVNTSSCDSLKKQYTLYQALGYIMLEEYDFALQQLYGIDPGNSIYFTERYHFYHGIIKLHTFDHAAAASHFVASASNEQMANEIRTLFQRTRLDRPKPELARRLSMLLPGLGQAYAGNRKGAINSLLLNTSLGVLALYTAVNYSFWEGAVSIVPWLLRYYLGGLKNAEMTALQRKQEKNQQILLEIIRIKN